MACLDSLVHVCCELYVPSFNDSPTVVLIQLRFEERQLSSLLPSADQSLIDIAHNEADLRVFDRHCDCS
jgi:hypothetical protein